MKHITVQSFTSASNDHVKPAMDANKRTFVIADRNLDTTM